MNNLPKFKLELTVKDRLSELLGWLAILFIWILLFSNYSNLPDIIPINYNLSNKIETYSERSSILILPSVATIIFIGLTIINKYPYIFNSSLYINSTNVIKQYTKATRSIRNFKLVLAILFVIIEILIIKMTKDQINFEDFWLFSLVKWCVLLPLIYLTIKSFKFI